MPGPLIMTMWNHPGAIALACRGEAAIVSRTRLEPGTLVRVWVDELARWVDAVVVDSYRNGYTVMSSLVGLSGYGSVEEWARAEEERHGGLPGWILHLRAVSGRVECS